MVITKEHIWKILEEVPDPEIPVLSVLDLGIVRDVKFLDNEGIEVIITPTYSGCPAMDMIAVNIKSVLQEKGIHPVRVTSVLHPAWTTEWMTEEGRRKLKDYGIAPPVKGSFDKGALFASERTVECPQCNSSDTRMVSQFGSTPCKALYQCNSCKEPFDYFKCH